MIEFIRSNENAISELFGIPALTNPVIPPCGTMGWLCSLHNFKTDDTSSVFLGLTIANASIG